MIGRKKLPSTPGMAGMMKRKTITTPCSVKAWLYVSALMIVRFGVRSSSRSNSAKKPPRANAVRTLTRYMRPIRL